MPLKATQWVEADNQTVIALINKAGSSSLSEALPVVANNLNCEKYPSRIAWIRHPVERLLSAYSFCRQYQIIVPFKHLQSWERFIDWALMIPDTHWTPQAELLTYQGRFLPTKIYRFESIAKTFQLYSDKALPHSNKSKKLDISAYRQDDINDYYQQDFKLWRLAGQ